MNLERSILLLGFVGLASAGIGGCGSSSSSEPGEVAGEKDGAASGSTSPSETGEDAGAQTDATAGSTPSEDGATSNPVTSDASSGDASSDATAPSADAGPTKAAPGIDAGAPVTGLSTEKWTWVPVDGAHCRDGSSTGFGINVNPASDKLMIFLQGGGACFSSTTCASNPSKFGASDFTSFQSTGAGGILSRSDAANAVKDWNFVFVPYCTGDIHAGNNPTGMVKGVTGVQQFVGYANMTLYLSRIMSTLPSTKLVLLTGVSAGGFGAAADYELVQSAFPNVPVYDLDDSGPDMEEPYAAGCQQQEVRQLWALDKTTLASCGSDCSDQMNFQLSAYKHLVASYPNVPFGFLDSTQDSVISYFFGLGQNNCASTSSLSGQMYTQGLDDMRTKLQSYTNFGAFLFSGTDHTSLESTAFDTRTAGNVKLTDWVAQIVNNAKVTNVGP
jgi:hypothetical protein